MIEDAYDRGYLKGVSDERERVREWLVRKADKWNEKNDMRKEEAILDLIDELEEKNERSSS